MVKTYGYGAMGKAIGHRTPSKARHLKLGYNKSKENIKKPTAKAILIF
jgi:hypothetical protein